MAGVAGVADELDEIVEHEGGGGRELPQEVTALGNIVLTMHTREERAEYVRKIVKHMKKDIGDVKPQSTPWYAYLGPIGFLPLIVFTIQGFSELYCKGKSDACSSSNGSVAIEVLGAFVGSLAVSLQALFAISSIKKGSKKPIDLFRKRVGRARCDSAHRFFCHPPRNYFEAGLAAHSTAGAVMFMNRLIEYVNPSSSLFLMLILKSVFLPTTAVMAYLNNLPNIHEFDQRLINRFAGNPWQEIVDRLDGMNEDERQGFDCKVSGVLQRKFDNDAETFNALLNEVGDIRNERNPCLLDTSMAVGGAVVATSAVMQYFNTGGSLLLFLNELFTQMRTAKIETHFPSGGWNILNAVVLTIGNFMVMGNAALNVRRKVLLSGDTEDKRRRLRAIIPAAVLSIFPFASGLAQGVALNKGPLWWEILGSSVNGFSAAGFSMEGAGDYLAEHEVLMKHLNKLLCCYRGDAEGLPLLANVGSVASYAGVKALKHHQMALDLFKILAMNPPEMNTTPHAIYTSHGRCISATSSSP